VVVVGNLYTAIGRLPGSARIRKKNVQPKAVADPQPSKFYPYCELSIYQRQPC
jgi:hypothetical protein